MSVMSKSPKSKVQSLLRFNAVIFCVGPDVQTDAGDGSVRVVAAGLLATEPLWSGGEPLFDFAEADRRKDSTHRIIDCDVHGDTTGSASSQRNFLFPTN